jgi:putative glutamine amidotransferase
MSQPLLIGVSARIYYPGSQGPLPGVFTKTLHYLEQSVAHWVLSGHAMAVMIPAVTKDSIVQRSEMDLHDYAAALDGLVLQGGNDVAPECYGEQPLQPEWAGDIVRDRYEIELIDAFATAGKPVFGICRGLQLINVMFGGSLYQDLATQQPASRAHRELGKYERHYHEVELVAGSRLASLYPGLKRATTNSIHHQAIKTLAPEFTVEARCPEDGTIEAIRRRGEGYVAAVQWHPEFHEPGSVETFDDSAMLEDFLEECRRVKAHSHRPVAQPASQPVGQPVGQSAIRPIAQPVS